MEIHGKGLSIQNHLECSSPSNPWMKLASVYVLLTFSKKDTQQKDEGAKLEVPSTPAANENGAVSEKTSPAEASVLIKVLPPIPEQEQRELFKWILEEKRKIKSSNVSDKKKIDEEKALLKEFIRAKSIPSL